MPAVHLLQCVGDLPDGGLGAGRVDRQRHQVVAQPIIPGAAGCRCSPGQFGQCGLHGRLVALGAQLLELGDLFGSHPAVLDLEHLDVGILVDLILVDADHRLLAGVDAGLGAGGRFLDTQFRDAVADRLCHSAALGHLGDVGAGPLGELMRQPLHVIGAAPRIDRAGGSGLLLQEQLGVARDAGGEIGRQRQRFVEGVGVQRLRVTLSGSHRLNAGAGDVVERVLGGERPAGGLRMSAQGQRFGALGAESGYEFTPQQAARAQLGHLHEEVHPDAPEERQPGRELVDVQPGVDTRLQIVHPVGKRVGQLEIGGGSRFLDVIPGDRDGIELRHLGAGVGEDVGDDPHRGLRRVDVGVADHELFENVVLDGPGELLRRNTLLLGGHHVEGQDRQHRSVHRHRDRHRRQVDTVEELPHVQNRVDGHPGHADVALHPGVVGVIAAVGGQVEGHRQALLAGRQVTSVERVGIGGGRETRVLANGPWLVDVHRRVGAADERGFTRKAVQRIPVCDGGTAVGADVERLDDDALGRVPVELLGCVSARGGRLCHPLGGRPGGRRRRGRILAQRHIGETRNSGDT